MSRLREWARAEEVVVSDEWDDGYESARRWVREVGLPAEKWPMRGVRVEDDKVIITVTGGNDAARILCGELVKMIEDSK